MRMPKQGRTDAGSIREVYNLYTDNTLSVTSITTVKGQTEKCIQVRVAIFIADSANMRWPCRVVILHQHNSVTTKANTLLQTLHAQTCQLEWQLL